MKTSRRLVANALAAGLGLSLWGCSTSTPGTAPQLDTNNIIVPAVGFVNPKFDPTVGNPSEIPLPIDILRSSAVDANLGLNLGIPDDGTDATRSIRTIRGFSTTGNIIIPFDGQVQGSSVTPQSILMFEGAESATQNDFTNTTIACNITVINPEENGAGGTSTVILQPQLPLRPGRDHFVVVTNQVLAQNRNIGSPRFAQLTKGTDPLVDGNGISQLFPLTNAQAQQLEPLRAAFQDWWQRAEDATGRQRSEIPLVFRFGTQNLFPAMGQILQTAAAETQGAKGITNAALAAGNANDIDNFFTNNGSPDLVNDNANIGQIFTGRISPKNFIHNSANPNIPIQPAAGNGIFRLAINPLDGTNFFQGTAIPLAQTGPIPPDPLISKGDLVVPFIACLPATPKPSPLGYPTVIYQHGIDRDKRDVLRVADELCRQGFAVIAIDLWLHGDLRLFTDPNPVPPSGTGFINPGNLRMTRDNIRQSAGNLLYLSAAIAFGKGELDGNAGPELAPAFSAPNTLSGITPGYIGHSLGGIVGTVYGASDPFLRRAVLSATGGRLTQLLLTSPPRGPVVIAPLGAGGLQQGTQAFPQFFLIAQTVLDDADPLNYALPLRTGSPLRAAAGFPVAANVLIQEVVGDQTIGNSATRDLARTFNIVPGFSHVQPVFEAVAFLTQAAAPFAGSGFSQVNFGNHGLFLNDVGNTEANARRVQRQAGDFLGTGQITAP